MCNEKNSVEFFVIKELTGIDLTTSLVIRETPSEYFFNTRTWKYIPAAQLPRKPSDILVKPIMADALMRLNPSIQDQPHIYCPG